MLLCACTHWLFNCKQNESSELSTSSLLSMHAWSQPSTDVQWVSVLVIGLILLDFLETKACIMAKLVAGLALKFFCWTLEPFKMSGISTLATPIFVFMSQYLELKLFFYWYGGLCSTFLWCTCFCLAENFFFLYLFLLILCIGGALG